MLSYPKHPDEISWERLTGDALAWATRYKHHLINRHRFSEYTARGWAIGCISMQLHLTENPERQADSDFEDQ